MAKKRNVYMAGEVRVPGVTTCTGILDKPALIPWAAKMAVEYLRVRWEPGKAYTIEEITMLLDDAKRAHNVRKTDAGDFGTEIHELVGAYIEGQLKPEDVTDPKKKKALENFIIATQGWQWLGSEIVLIHPELLYGGTADGLARLPDGRIILPDFKTSSGVWPEMDLQIAMYAMATPLEPALQELWKQITEGRILHFDKEHLSWQVLERDLKIQFPFIPSLRRMYDWKKQFASAW